MRDLFAPIHDMSSLFFLATVILDVHIMVVKHLSHRTNYCFLKSLFGLKVEA